MGGIIHGGVNAEPEACCSSGLKVRNWLRTDLQSPEYEVCLYLSFRHSGQGWEGLKVTRLGHRRCWSRAVAAPRSGSRQASQI